MQSWVVLSLEALRSLCLDGKKKVEMYSVVGAYMASGLAHTLTDVTQESSRCPRPLLLAVS